MISDRNGARLRMLSRAVLVWVVLAAPVAFCQLQGGEVTGTIKNPDGVPVPDAVVVLSSEDSGIGPVRGTTNATGRYALCGVPFGSYKLGANAPGYQDAEPKLVIVSSAVRSLDLTLIPLSKSAHPQSVKPEFRGDSQKGPAFSSAGIRGTIAPSGYSTGLSGEETAQVKQNVSEVGIELFAELVPQTSANCSREPALVRAVREQPRGFGPNRDLGLFYLGNRDFDRSVQYLRAAHMASPEDEKSSRDLAVALLGASRHADAIAILEHLALTQPKKASILRLLAMAHEQARDAEKAKSAYREAAALDAGVENQFYCGMGLIRLGAAADASDLFVAAETSHPESAQLWMGLGVAQELLEEKSPAVQSMLRAVEKDPEYFPPYSFLADMADSVPGSQGEIRKRLAEFVVAHPESSEAHLDYGLGLWKQSRSDPAAGSSDEIVAQLKAAIEKDPRVERAHFALGQVYADITDLAGAEREFRAALELEHDNAQAHYRLAQVYRRQGKTEMASEEIEKFRLLHGNPGEDTVLPPLSLGGLSYPIKRSSEAGQCPPKGK